MNWTVSTRVLDPGYLYSGLEYQVALDYESMNT